MSSLSVTRSLVSNTNPTETQFDTMRTDLLTFFNTTRDLNEDNIAPGSMSYLSLTGAVPDDEPLRWEDDHAIIKYDNANDRFIIQNTEGDIIFAHRDDDEIVEFLSLRESDGALEVFGNLTFIEDTGYQGVDLQWYLAKYRKPRLVYSTDDIVTIEANGPSGETIVAGPTRFWTIYDTTCSLAVSANGEVNTDTGTAVSGRGNGVARTADRWYFIYAVQVQYGDQADGINAILIANTTSPVAANISTLDTAFGADKWVYMGCVRNGYNRAGVDNIIIPFVVDECGYTRFLDGEGGYPVGVTLASDNDTDNLVYTVAIGNDGDTKLPEVATRVIFGGHRESHGFEMYYEEASSNENHMITTGCYHVSELATLVPVVYMEVPLLSGYEVHIIMGNVQTNKRITLAGFLDHYV